MKKFIVEAQALTREQIEGTQSWGDTCRFAVDDDYILAASADDAIFLVKSWLVENWGYELLCDDIYVYRDDSGEVVDGWGFFSAKEV